MQDRQTVWKRPDFLLSGESPFKNSFLGMSIAKKLPHCLQILHSISLPSIDFITVPEVESYDTTRIFNFFRISVEIKLST